ncbi:4-hydroxybenzoate polyprenyl transferase [Leucogyrophana mollusca]|uniref:4-hydroxybenzoate polyprenyl transferase n=1 Tax=Leucogyrophana mollusca TaxID=85980 RepID=A0ACB8BN63_9AGAM|nr:4-hydroxybenzoate polyprenyl transferase [Leucogyrophana mollusca]
MPTSVTETQPLLKNDGPSPTVPPKWQLYWQLARMHKFPTGSMVLFWPAAWGFLLSARNADLSPVQVAGYLAALFVGSTLLHCAACTLNDICDRDFDRQVERTKNRPLAAGHISVWGATVFLGIQLAAFFAMLSVFNRNAFICGTFGVFPLHALYPLMKRWTWWPQAWLGLAMNWGLPTAWLIVSPDDVKSAPMWVLTGGTLCWTIVYDTIYACQDRKDDVKAGVKSTALLFGSWVKEILSIFAVGFVGSLIYAGVATGRGIPFYIIAVGGCAGHLLWQLLSLDVNSPEDCWKKFQSNGNLGYVVTGGILLDHYIRHF